MSPGGCIYPLTHARVELSTRDTTTEETPMPKNLKIQITLLILVIAALQIYLINLVA